MCVIVFYFSAAIQARNVEYDEVVLPPTSSSSAIPTELNLAYITTTTSQT